MKSAAAIVFDLRPPVLLAVFVLVLGLLGVMSVWSSGLATHQRVAAVIGFVVMFTATRAMALLLRRRWRRANWSDDGVWTLLDGQQQLTTATLVGWSVLGLSLILRLRTTTGERALLYLMPDNLDRDTRRRLRVRLEQGGDGPRPLPPTAS